MKFKIGDVVVMNKLANNHYSITMCGSVGKILQNVGDYYAIKFESLTGEHENYHLNHVFPIDERCIELATKLYEVLL